MRVANERMLNRPIDSVQTLMPQRITWSYETCFRLTLSEVWVHLSGLQCSSITADNIFTQIKKKLGKEI